jgi:hypothetical protein
VCVCLCVCFLFVCLFGDPWWPAVQFPMYVITTCVYIDTDMYSLINTR